ncbi:MAG: sigma-70 family RNA polymerase sigma factor [Acidiferrobacterales bacterium]|nr:sigma-70 family RNA polymerase sigma factor [Acidiferrobacterales bacterium]
MSTNLSQANNDPDLAQLFRAESGRILSILMLQTRDLSLAEDALQDAFLEASNSWVKNSRPKKESAWLLTVARRRLIDRLRMEGHRCKEQTLQAIYDTQTINDNHAEGDDYPDERLRLIFTCCHPALAENVRVPLTLKTLCGLSINEIARAYLISEPAMEQRITRAKRKIRDVGIAYEVPCGEALETRLDSVLRVIYLIYNESYSAFEGQTLTRDDLANEAIRLARLLQALLPLPEVEGLLALLLLHDSRRLSRSSSSQAFIPLEHQNRLQWNQALISEGVSLSLASLAKGPPGQYQIQAAISSLHALAPSWGDTDWQQIAELYEVLMQIQRSPVVALNKSMAIAYAGDVKLALKEVNELSELLKTYQPFYVARAELYLQNQQTELATLDLSQALKLTSNNAEQDYLKSKLEQLKTTKPA